jgi:hypothetical protein
MGEQGARRHGVMNAVCAALTRSSTACEMLQGQGAIT